MQLLLKGLLENVSEKEFEGKKSWNYQFIDKSNGVLKVINVKSDSDLDLKVGSEVSKPVTVSHYNGNLYYKFV